jgi:SAM-dependent methyltransferase
MSAISADRETVAQLFDHFAAFYDRFTAHHDYEDWMSSLEALAREHGLIGRRLLDVACGTGKSLLPMLDRGYEVTGCDASAEMLARALPKVAGRARLLEADMRDLPMLGTFDLVTCIDEPLNYLLEVDDLQAAFESAARCLEPEGIYLFDLNTLHAYRSLFSSDSVHEHDGWLFVWRGLSSDDLPPGSTFEFAIEAFQPLPSGDWARHTSPHAQRHYQPELVRDLLAGAGLECVALRGQFPDGRLEPQLDEQRHTKAIYVCTPRP